MDGGTWRKPRQGRLSPEIRSGINRTVRLALQSRDAIDAADLQQFMQVFDDFSPFDAPMVARNVSRAFADYIWILELQNRTSLIKAAFETAMATGRLADLAWLHLFNYDGIFREAALQAIKEPPRSGFWMAALLYRLADWVPEVRRAAERCILRLGDTIRSDIVIDALAFALAPENATRMSLNGQPAGLHFLARSDVFDHLRSRLLLEPIGGSHRLLRQITATTNRFDHMLDALAHTARHPAVRARALKLLLTGRAEDISGYRQVYVKSSNTFHHEAVVTSRQLEVAADVPALIAAGARDRAATVRKIAADGLVFHRHSLADIETVISAFDHEENAAVRERVDFVKRQLRTAT